MGTLNPAIPLPRYEVSIFPNIYSQAKFTPLSREESTVNKIEADKAVAKVQHYVAELERKAGRLTY
jgi:hypothetical protein